MRRNDGNRVAIIYSECGGEDVGDPLALMSGEGAADDDDDVGGDAFGLVLRRLEDGVFDVFFHCFTCDMNSVLITTR